MSQKEFQRVKVIENAVAGRLSVGEAARLLQLSERQVQRLKRRYRPDSVAWVHHGNRGRPMPWALPAAQKQHDSRTGPRQVSLASTILISARNCTAKSICRSAARPCAAFCAAPSWHRRRSAAPRRYRARRLPRPRFGMMVLTDASRHDWLEGRGPELTLIGFQDDATSQILSAHFQLEAGKHPRLSPRSARHGHALTACPSVSTAIATASSSATIPTGPWPNNSPENSAPPI